MGLGYKLLLVAVMLSFSAVYVSAVQIVTGNAIPSTLQTISPGISLPIPVQGIMAGNNYFMPVITSPTPLPLGNILYTPLQSKPSYPCLKKSPGVLGVMIYQVIPAGPSEVIITEFMRQQLLDDCMQTATAVALRALNLTENLTQVYEELMGSTYNNYDRDQLLRLLRSLVKLTNGTANITHYGPNPVNINGVADGPSPPPPGPLPPLTLRVVFIRTVGEAGQGHAITIQKIHNDTQLQNISIDTGGGTIPRPPRPFLVSTVTYFDPADGKMHAGQIARADFPTPSEGPNDEGDEFIKLSDGKWAKMEDAIDITKNG